MVGEMVPEVTVAIRGTIIAGPGDLSVAVPPCPCEAPRRSSARQSTVGAAVEWLDAWKRAYTPATGNLWDALKRKK